MTIELALRLVVGATALIRAGRGAVAWSATTDRLETGGFTSPSGAAALLLGLQLVGGLAVVLGFFTPFGAGLIAAVAIVEASTRPRQRMLPAHVPSVIDVALLAGAAAVMVLGPGEPTLGRRLELEVVGGAFAFGGAIVALLIAGGAMSLVDSKQAARAREGGAARARDELVGSIDGAPPREPVDAEEATDPAASTEGEGAPDPVRLHEQQQEDRGARGADADEGGDTDG